MDDPTDPHEAKEAAEPIDKIDPVDPIDRIDSLEYTDNNELREWTDQREVMMPLSLFGRRCQKTADQSFFMLTTVQPLSRALSSAFSEPAT